MCFLYVCVCLFVYCCWFFFVDFVVVGVLEVFFGGFLYSICLFFQASLHLCNEIKSSLTEVRKAQIVTLLSLISELMARFMKGKGLVVHRRLHPGKTTQ